MLRKIVKSSLVTLLSLSPGCFLDENTKFHISSTYPYMYIQKDREDRQNPQCRVFSCNSIRDVDKDGKIDYPIDIVNEKSVFSTSETITLMCEIVGGAGKELEVVVHNQEMRPTWVSLGRIKSNSEFGWIRGSPGDLQPGITEATWSLDGIEIGKTVINILDKNALVQKHSKTVREQKSETKVPDIKQDSKENVFKNFSNYLKSQEITNFTLYKKDGDNIEFAVGTMIPIDKERYVRFVDGDLKQKSMWCDNKDKFSAIGEIVLVQKEGEHQKTRLVNETLGLELYLEEIPDYTQTNEFMHINYDNGNVTTRLVKKIVKERTELERMILPNGVIVQKYLKPGNYEFDENGEVINQKNQYSTSLDSFIEYRNPKISLPYKDHTFLIIPSDTNWSKIDLFAKLNNNGEIVSIIRNDDKTKAEEYLFPLPRNNYVVDRSDLEEIVSEATKIEQQGNFQEALELYKKKIENYSNYPTLFHNLGILYWKMGSIDKAIESLQQSLQKDPEYDLAIRTHLNLGNVYLQKKEFDKAEDEFKKIFEIVPDQPEALYSLGALEYNERKNQDKAFQYWNRLKVTESSQASDGKLRENVTSSTP